VSDAPAALCLLAIDPGLGASLRAAPGPVRDRFLARLQGALPVGTPWRRIPANVSDDRLLGGLDLPATLAAGRPIAERGLLAAADGGVMVIAMAERLPAGTASRIAAAMDTGRVSAERDGLSLQGAANFGVLALDEGASDEERPVRALMDRLALHLDLSAVSASDAEAFIADPAQIEAARGALAGVEVSDADIEALAGTTLALGIGSLRAPLLALRAARAAAALAGRAQVEDDDLALAARLVLGPRATILPAPEQPEEQDQPEPPPPEPDPPEQESEQDRQDDKDRELAEMVLEAARAAIPKDLLALLAQGGAMRSRQGGPTGAAQANAKRGRPIGVRRGELGGGARLSLLDTLRAAAPWQQIRRVQTPAKPGRVLVRRDDFRIRRFTERTRTTTLFIVDASGSSALNRLAEAKGAVELLLAECYVRRDRVALLSVRGKTAELLLPPTSSLVRAKRSLAGLPGGGGTPIAAGIDSALEIALGVRRAGQTPMAVFLTDGRANVSRDGKPGRPAAEQDALAAAAGFRAAGIAAILVDTAPQPYRFARTLADAMAARYLALPYADAAMLSRAVAAAQAA
jgi:magnesium chelatase subunit D